MPRRWTDAQACEGCMTKLVIVAVAAAVSATFVSREGAATRRNERYQLLRQAR
jgi:hypothetical protein